MVLIILHKYDSVFINELAKLKIFKFFVTVFHVQIFRIANPSISAGGGELRSYNVIKYLSRKAKITVVPPLSALCGKNVEEIIKDIKSLNVEVPYKIEELAKKCKSYPKNPLSIVKMERDYYSNFIEEAKTSDIIFSDHTSYSLVSAISLLREKSNVKSVTVLQEGNLKSVYNLKCMIRLRGFNALTLLKYFRNLYGNMIFKKYSKDLDFLLGVSKASIDEFKELGLVRKETPWKVLKPANAFEKDLLNYSSSEKEDYAIFFARLIPEKGIFELPRIWKKVKERIPNAKLVVVGKFFNEKIKKKFLSMAKDGIEYRGYLPREELIKTVAKAKVFVYPTHFDAFPLAVLESLALKTPVVAYSIPTIVEIFGKLKAVKFVKEFDVSGMANNIVEFYNLKEYDSIFDEEYKSFINFYSSWEKVADAEYNALKEFLETK